MKELREKANSYAEENVSNVLKEAFAKVYADGYRNGYKDCQEVIPVDLKSNQTEFVDLGLPSGTLWATDYEVEGTELVYLPYENAKSLNLPTKEQWEELISNCKWEYDHAGDFNEAYCIGPNGNIVIFRITGQVHINKCTDSSKAFFWISDDNETNEKNAICIYNEYYGRAWITKERIMNCFSGYKLPIRLVKEK